MTTSEKLDRPYITFYKVMLILSTIGTSIAALGILGLSNTLSLYATAPLFITCSILLNVVAAVSIYALVLLWQKNPLGISLKLSAYAVSIVVTAVALTGLQPYAAYVTTEAKEQVTQQAPQNMTQILEMVPSVVDFMLYTGLVGSIILSITFALLWRSAWRKQQAADTPSTAHHKHTKSKD